MNRIIKIEADPNQLYHIAFLRKFANCHMTHKESQEFLRLQIFYLAALCTVVTKTRIQRDLEGLSFVEAISLAKAKLTTDCRYRY